MIKEVSLLYAPFRHFVSGHVCLIFKLSDGKEIVISPEARTEKFIPILGFLPFYKLKYSKLEYAEYIEKYQRTSRVFHSTRLEIEHESALSLYKEMSERMSHLEENREIYHILSNSCITNTFRHLQQSAKFDLTLVQRVKLHFKPHVLAEIIEMGTPTKAYKS
jgi:hypothetical protein